MTLRFVVFGMLFGFVLSRAGITDYDTIAAMFLLTDAYLAGVIGTAVALSALGFLVIRRRRLRTLRREPIFLGKKQPTPYLMPVAVLFGIGWAISGTCPGTSLAQIGDGHWAGLATFVGIVAGSCLARPRATQTAPSLDVPRTRGSRLSP